jgi:hypothetical protein
MLPVDFLDFVTVWYWKQTELYTVLWHSMYEYLTVVGDIFYTVCKYIETSLHHSHVCHFAASIVHFLWSPKIAHIKCVIRSDISFLKVSFPHAGHSELLVLTHTIPGIIMFEKKEAKVM